MTNRDSIHCALPLQLAEEKSQTPTSLTGIPIYRVTLVREGSIGKATRQELCNSATAHCILRHYLADADREHFVVLLLNHHHQFIGINTVSIGSLTSTSADPRDVFKPAILSNAAAIICGHNHLSDNPQPSDRDRLITKRLVQAGLLLGITVLDHIIVGETSYFSFVDKGLM